MLLVDGRPGTAQRADHPAVALPRRLARGDRAGARRAGGRAHRLAASPREHPAHLRRDPGGLARARARRPLRRPLAGVARRPRRGRLRARPHEPDARRGERRRAPAVRARARWLGRPARQRGGDRDRPRPLARRAAAHRRSRRGSAGAGAQRQRVGDGHAARARRGAAQHHEREVLHLRLDRRLDQRRGGGAGARATSARRPSSGRGDRAARGRRLRSAAPEARERQPPLSRLGPAPDDLDDVAQRAAWRGPLSTRRAAERGRAAGKPGRADRWRGAGTAERRGDRGGHDRRLDEPRLVSR